MCGLVGIAGDFTAKSRDVMKDLIFFNTLRGRDSTGLSVYNQRKNTVSTRKLTVPGVDFVMMPFVNEMLHYESGVWLAHGRARTIGDVSKLNAHPFEVLDDKGRISMVGAHNGTLSNKFDLERALDDERFGTDSEAFINLIRKLGPKKAVAEAKGAWAVTYWDCYDNSINFFRNKERPLYYAYSADNTLLIWASEPWMIRISCMRNGLDLEEHEKSKEPVIRIVPEDTLLKWEIPSFKFDGSDEDKRFSEPVREGGLLGKPEEAKFRYTGNYGAHGGSYPNPNSDDYGEGWYNNVDWTSELDDDPPFQKDDKKDTKADDARGSSSKNKPGPSHVVGFEGQYQNRQFVEELKKSGCDWCGDEIKDENFGWLDEMSLVCGRCMRGEHIIVSPGTERIIERVLTLVRGDKDDKPKSLIEVVKDRKKEEETVLKVPRAPKVEGGNKK